MRRHRFLAQKDAGVTMFHQKKSECYRAPLCPRHTPNPHLPHPPRNHHGLWWRRVFDALLSSTGEAALALRRLGQTASPLPSTRNGGHASLGRAKRAACVGRLRERTTSVDPRAAVSMPIVARPVRARHGCCCDVHACVRGASPPPRAPVGRGG